MKLVYKILHYLRVLVCKTFSAYKDYCCRKVKFKITQIFKKGKIDMLVERKPISLAKTETQAKAIGYTHDEWVAYLASTQETSDVEASEINNMEGDNTNV